MPTDTKVTIYYGPLSWVKTELGKRKRVGLLEIVYERDEASRHFTHSVPGQEPPEEKVVERLGHVVAESGDYASLNEHVITNFAGLIRSINPKQLHLHNPPALVQTQLERIFDVKVKRFKYPVVTRDALAQVHEEFANHLVGQAAVKERLLAALYPLTSAGRVKPVVLMFYGPSGVGKTETAQFVNSLLGGELLRKQFSMFQNEKFASYLFGGHHMETSFARDLLDRESGVILIDEFDKASPVFHSAFYQLFDGGVFEDKNYYVELGPALIICTSNYESENQIREALGDALYSRFDVLIRFQQLSREEIQQILDKLVDRRFETLTLEERAVLDQEALKLDLRPLVSNGGNVRKLGKTVDEVISIHLVKALVSGNLG